MPRKFTIGLGNVPIGTSALAGTSISIGSGSFVNSILGNSTVVNVATFQPIGSVTSQESFSGYHSTLFEDFDLTAAPTYNFYTADELSPTASYNLRTALMDIPRYVTLSWNRAPMGTFPAVSNKGTRGPDQRASMGPPLPIPASIVTTSVINGYISPGTIRAGINTPLPIVFRGKTLTDDAFLTSHVDHLGIAAPYMSTGSAVGSFQPIARVNFVDPSIAGAMDGNRVSMATDHLQAASLASMAKIMGSLETISEFNQDSQTTNPPPQFPVDPSTSPGRYVGYSIERYDLGEDGSMVLGGTFHVMDPNETSFVDRNVSYLGNYAYRIRSLFQWTRPPNIGPVGPSMIDVAPASGSSISSFGSLSVSSFYAGAWSIWAGAVVQDTDLPDPPDEMGIIPRSTDGILRAYWKMPPDPRNDISAIRLYRRSVGTQWVLLGEFPPTNGAFDDRPPRRDTRFIYGTVSVTYHGLLSPFSEQISALVTSTPTKGEHLIKRVAGSGESLGSYPVSLTSSLGRELVVNDSVTFYCRSAGSDIPLNMAEYVIELRSLSTGERLVVDLEADSNAFVPQATEIVRGGT